MRIRLTAHFDGRVIVPHEKVSLPTDEALTVEVETRENQNASPVDVRRAAVERLRSRAIDGLSILDKSLTRESMYNEDIA